MKRKEHNIVSVRKELDSFKAKYGISLDDTVYYKGREARVTAINLLEEPQTVVLDFGTERIDVESLVKE